MHTTVYSIYIIQNILFTTYMAHLYTTTQHINIYAILQFQNIVLLL
jgi:hypothetical protein